MSRPAAICGLLVAVAAIAACHRAQRPLPRGTPVILISIDTLRADRLPAWGYRDVETPHMDRFRRDAVLFRHAYAPTPMTLPSHVTMLTGLLPPSHGVRNNVGFTFRGDQVSSLPRLLKAQGYAAGATVSSFVLRAETGLARDFDFYEDSIDPRPGAEFGEYQRPGGRTLSFARDWVDARAGKPFFLFFHIYEPHLPYEPPEPFRTRYAHALYDGEIAAADAIAGGLLDHLRAQGLYDRTLIVLTSDHGEGLGDHGEEQHSILLYREAIAVPLLIKLPGSRRAGESVEAPAQLADILPTVTDLLGLGTPPGLDGVPLLRSAVPTRRALYAETLYPRLQLGWSELRSLVDDRWHYIHGPRPELYDMVADPRETRDLAASASSVAGRMGEELERAHPLRLARPQAVDVETAERLAALGYAGGLRDPSPGPGPLPNPREALPLLDRFRQAVRLASARRGAEAALALHAIVSQSPGLIEAWTKLGEVNLELGRYQEAATALQEAIDRSLAPSADTLIALGYARLRLGRLDEAEAAGSRAVAESALRAHELLARVALARGRREEAERQVAAALARPEPQPSSLLLRAEVRIQSGNGAGALASVEEAERRAAQLHMGPVYNLEFLRADALARVGRMADAQAAYRKEIEAYPQHLLAYTNLAVLHHLEGRPDRRDQAIEDMVAKNPGDAALVAAERTCAALGLGRQAANWRARAASLR
ncbi:MAG TPA: sulfatase-like hydrolase/transferase [Vicinamibacteria bacterium]|nr:sulfatase-like hydrolase/transferase [Vicinamibacteria bacterium]